MSLAGVGPATKRIQTQFQLGYTPTLVWITIVNLICPRF